MSSNITLAAADIGAVPTTRTINGKPLSTNITLTAVNVNALAKTDAEPWTTSKTTSRDPWILTYRKIGYKLMQFQLQAVFRGSQLEHNTDEVVGYTPIFVKEAFYFPVWMTVAGGVAGIGVGMVNEKQ